ncbi:MAG: hypothetical protein NXI04_19330, partial [Planctomycetaceae bacterium]|nr:hypothetical protein [Planctomycetaceae bacterium]
MSTYWIRNRGRVQGPFTLDRIQGLLRRGRFSRHFHVSLDKKEWLPAEEFPELFGSRRRRGRDDDEDYEDSPFRGGGSPFDDDDDEPSPHRKSRSKSKGRTAVLDEDDDDDDDDDNEDDDWEDDEEWDEDEGLVDRLIGMVESNLKLIGGALVAVLGVLCWFLFFGESFAQDQEDMQTLMDVNMRITTGNSTGMAPNDWLALQEQIESELSTLVKRLESTASSQDHIKQELLFIARDDLAARFKELPDGLTDATQRIMQRFARIDEMIKSKTRQHAGSILTLPTRPPAQNAGSVPGRPGGQPGGDGNTGPAEQLQQAPGVPGQPGNGPPGVSGAGGPSGSPESNNPDQQRTDPPGSSPGQGGFLS